MSSLPPLAKTISLGGRGGSVKTTEEGFSLAFKAPSAANAQGLTPEHFFGAAWAACFNGAVMYIAQQSGYSNAGITVTAHVQLHPEGPQSFSVELLVSIPKLDKAKAEEVLTKAHAMCAYSKATRGNVSVKITLA